MTPSHSSILSCLLSGHTPTETLGPKLRVQPGKEHSPSVQAVAIRLFLHHRVLLREYPIISHPHGGAVCYRHSIGSGIPSSSTFQLATVYPWCLAYVRATTPIPGVSVVGQSLGCAFFLKRGFHSQRLPSHTVNLASSSMNHRLLLPLFAVGLRSILVQIPTRNTHQY